MKQSLVFSNPSLQFTSSLLRPKTLRRLPCRGQLLSLMQTNWTFSFSLTSRCTYHLNLKQTQWWSIFLTRNYSSVKMASKFCLMIVCFVASYQDNFLKAHKLCKKRLIAQPRASSLRQCLSWQATSLLL